VDDEKKNIKLIDFGFAAQHTDKYSDKLMNESLGTTLYMAPELHLHQPYDGKAVDIFALAVALFTMVVGHPPFHHTQSSDMVYKCVAQNKTNIFWRYHSKANTKNDQNSNFGDDFKDLVVKMLALDPK